VSRETALVKGRAFLEGALTDACIVDREDPTLTVTNPTTGVVTKTYVTVYTGRCEVKQGGGTQAGQTDVAEATLRLASLDLKLPVVGSENVRADDRVTITACVFDTALVGRVFFTTNQPTGSHKTARRVSLTEALS
jgi:hypothetical protein